MAGVRHLTFQLFHLYLLLDVCIYLYLFFVFAFVACIIVLQSIAAGGGIRRNLSEWLVSAAKQEEETHLLTPFP